jgi:hypothetical protein
MIHGRIEGKKLNWDIFSHMGVPNTFIRVSVALIDRAIKM